MKGEGRGKVDVSGKSYKFSYESAINEKEFLLGVDVPFYKEEFLKMSGGGDDIVMEGALYRRLLNEFSHDLAQRYRVKNALSSLGRLLESIRVCRGDSRGKECFSGRLDGRWKLAADGKKGRLMFSHFPYRDKSYRITFDNFNIRDGYFNRQRIDIRFPQGRIIMDFSINACSRE